MRHCSPQYVYNAVVVNLHIITLFKDLEVADVEAPFAVLDDGDGDGVEVVFVVWLFQVGVGVAAND